MKKLLYLSLLTLCLSQSACTMMVKGLAKLVVKEYNNHTDIKFSNLQLADSSGKTQTFGEIFKGKTVYLYLWKNQKNTPPNENNKAYKALKERFAKYPDVTFANLYIGQDHLSTSYKLVESEYSKQIFTLLSVENPTPFIIGKDGSILSYKGPQPNNTTLVDYVLYQANQGEDGTKAAKRLIKGVNGKQRFRSEKLRVWYTNHFGKAPDETLNFSVSTSQ